MPRSLKNPGDYILQGSNNTLIRLGTNHIHQTNDDFTQSYNNSIFLKNGDSVQAWRVAESIGAQDGDTFKTFNQTDVSVSISKFIAWNLMSRLRRFFS